MDRPGLFPAAAIIFVVVFVVGLLIATDSGTEDEAVAGTTIPVAPTIPATTTTPAIPAAPTTRPSVVAAAAAPSDVDTLDGWHNLEPPFGVRWSAATAWTGTELLVWGGDEASVYNSPHSGNNSPTDTGYVYDPAVRSWRPMPEGPLCAMAGARGLWIGSEMVIWSSRATQRLGDCALAAAYNPSDGTWRRFDESTMAFFGRIGEFTSVVWTGELLVAPSLEAAIDPSDGSVLDLPPLPRNADDGVFSPRIGHWTGEEVLVLGSDELYSWAPGDSEWVEIPGPPITDRARTSSWDGDELVAVNYEMETARWDGSAWTAVEALPLRFYECVPVGLAAGSVLAVEFCGPFAVWDEGRDLFVPLPAPVDFVTASEWGGGLPVVAGDSLYVIGDGAFRYQLVTEDDGRLLLPATMPIGVHFLDRPLDFDLTTSIGPTGLATTDDGYSEQMSFQFMSDTTTCSVISTYLGGTEPSGLKTSAAVIVARTGEVVFGNEYLDAGSLTVRLPSRNGSDVVDISCGDPDTTRQFAAQMWEPAYSEGR